MEITTMIKRAGDDGFFEDIFNAAYGRGPLWRSTWEARSSNKAGVDTLFWTTTHDGVATLVTELPGVKREAVSVSVGDQTVVVSAVDRFGATRTLSSSLVTADGRAIDPETVRAALADGLLTISGDVFDPKRGGSRAVKVE